MNYALAAVYYDSVDNLQSDFNFCVRHLECPVLAVEKPAQPPLVPTLLRHMAAHRPRPEHERERKRARVTGDARTPDARSRDLLQLSVVRARDLLDLDYDGDYACGVSAGVSVVVTALSGKPLLSLRLSDEACTKDLRALLCQEHGLEHALDKIVCGEQQLHDDVRLRSLALPSALPLQMQCVRDRPVRRKVCGLDCIRLSVCCFPSVLEMYYDELMARDEYHGHGSHYGHLVLCAVAPRDYEKAYPEDHHPAFGVPEAPGPIRLTRPLMMRMSPTQVEESAIFGLGRKYEDYESFFWHFKPEEVRWRVVPEATRPVWLRAYPYGEFGFKDFASLPCFKECEQKHDWLAWPSQRMEEGGMLSTERALRLIAPSKVIKVEEELNPYLCGTWASRCQGL